MLVKTTLASTGAPRHSDGSRNLPRGNQPSLKAKSQITIKANQGVNMVNSSVPDMVAVYSMNPPRRQAMVLPRKKPA